MSRLTLKGDPPIDVQIKRAPQARRMSLRVSQVDRGVRLTLPVHVPDREAWAFLSEKEAWLRKALGTVPEGIAVKWDGSVCYLGEQMSVVEGTKRGVHLQGETLRVYGPADQVGARVKGWMKAQARLVLSQSVARYADRLGKQPNRIVLKDTRSRWGSCSSAGNLNFSWRLVMAPISVLDYVAAHEVAHLAEMNHSSAFWDTVTAIHGPYAQERKWLRVHGSALQRYRFEPCS